MNPPNCIRSLRRRHELSQGDLALLLDLDQSTASRLETGDISPTLGTAFALQVVFGDAPRRLFPNTYADVEDAVMRRAAAFDRKLRKHDLPERAQKRRLLKSMVLRAKGNTSGA